MTDIYEYRGVVVKQHPETGMISVTKGDRAYAMTQDTQHAVRQFIKGVCEKETGMIQQEQA